MSKLNLSSGVKRQKCSRISLSPLNHYYNSVIVSEFQPLKLYKMVLVLLTIIFPLLLCTVSGVWTSSIVWLEMKMRIF